jgi:hypothetical protein
MRRQQNVHLPLINTQLQLGVRSEREKGETVSTVSPRTRDNGELCDDKKTVEMVGTRALRITTQLKLGVNEKMTCPRRRNAQPLVSSRGSHFHRLFMASLREQFLVSSGLLVFFLQDD